jgi:hypothetical protein
MQIRDIFDWNLEVDSDSFCIIISSHYKSSIAVLSDKTKESIALFYFDISKIVRSWVSCFKYFVFLAHFNVLIFSCIHKQIVT